MVLPERGKPKTPYIIKITPYNLSTKFNGGVIHRRIMHLGEVIDCDCDLSLGVFFSRSGRAPYLREKKDSKREQAAKTATKPKTSSVKKLSTELK